MQNRIIFLDGIRGFSALWVFFGHLAANLAPEGRYTFFYQRISPSAFLGVEIFFVLSGFLITSNLISEQIYFQNISLFNFYIKRILRIFPLYFGILIICLWVFPILGPGIPRSNVDVFENQLYLWTFLANIAMTFKGPIFHGPLIHLNHFWSIAIEEQFYLIWPLIFCLFKKKTVRYLLLLSVLIAYLTRLYFVLQLGNDYAPRFFTLCRMDSIAMGCLLALFPLKHRNRFFMYPVTFWFSLVLALYGIHFWFLDKTTIDQIPKIFYLLAQIFPSVGVAGLIGSALENPGSNLGRWFESRFLRSCGKYSYAIYLFHGFVIQQTLRHLKWCNPWGISGEVLKCFIILALVYSLSILSWHLYENFFMNLRSRMAR